LGITLLDLVKLGREDVSGANALKRHYALGQQIAAQAPFRFAFHFSQADTRGRAAEAAGTLLGGGDLSDPSTRAHCDGGFEYHPRRSGSNFGEP
jgi:hypothetical protein